MFAFVACAAILLLGSSLEADPVKIPLKTDGSSSGGAAARRLEDFFWTGSGDGPGAPERAAIVELEVPPAQLGTHTVVSTTTLLATLYLESADNATAHAAPCGVDCAVPTPADKIQPTRTLSGSEARYPPTDRRYWLLTIVATDTAAGVEWEAKLAALYSTAFERQLERHLGLLNRTTISSPAANSSSAKMYNRQAKRSTNEVELINSTAPVFKREIATKPEVTVYVHNVSADAGSGSTEILYSVLAGGRPILAETAAEDMRLVTDEEASAEFGYPVLTKSEPYLRSVRQWSSWGERSVVRVGEPWMVAAAAIAACVLLLLLVVLIVIAAQKRNRRARSPNAARGKDNEAFTGRESQSKSADVLDDPAMSAVSKEVKFIKQRSLSSASGESMDSPSYMPRRRLLGQGSGSGSGHHGLYAQVSPKSKQYRIKSKLKSNNAKKRRSHNAVGAAGGEWSREEFASSSDQASGDALVTNKPSSAGSVGSYLSLPSVRSFPRCDVPEPLSRILEPTSVHCLDWEGEGSDPKRHPGLVRHLSMGSADPGIIGPMVWNLHCKKVEGRGAQEANVMPCFQHGAGGSDLPEVNPRQTHRRYRDLIDGAMQLWSAPASEESRATAGPSGDGSERPPDRNILDTVRGRSAIVKSSTEDSATGCPARPRSAAPRRPREDQECKQAPSPSKKAWGSGAPSPLVRPLSAGPFHRPPSPRVDVARVLAPDPAAPRPPSEAAATVAPLLAAIQHELKKFGNSSEA